jgi:hypothetical protein
VVVYRAMGRKDNSDIVYQGKLLWKIDYRGTAYSNHTQDRSNGNAIRRSPKDKSLMAEICLKTASQKVSQVKR